MSIDINGVSSSKIHGPPDESQVKQQQTKQPVEAEISKSSVSDTVSISDSAASLGRVNNTLDSTPVVDAKRVEQMKQAIADGSFKVDAERVADKLMKFESILTSKE